MSIEIKEISAQETYNLRHQVMWPDKPRDFVILSNDEEALHFGLSKDSTITAVVSLFINNNSAQFRKLATKNSEQGNGYGSILLKYLMSIVSNKNIEVLWCNARSDKTSFYEKLEMIQTPKKFVKEGVNYVIMERIFTNNR